MPIILSRCSLVITFVLLCVMSTKTWIDHGALVEQSRLSRSSDLRAFRSAFVSAFGLCFLECPIPDASIIFWRVFSHGITVPSGSRCFNAWCSTIRVVTHVLWSDCFHRFCYLLIFPRLFARFKIVIESLPTDIKHPAIKSLFAFLRAAANLKCNETHSHVFADFRRLAAKKALASWRNSFSSSRRLTSFDNSFTCFRSSTSSSFIVKARAGVCVHGPRSSRPWR